MERTHPTSRHGMTTRSASRTSTTSTTSADSTTSTSITTSSPALPAQRRGQAPARQALSDPTPPTTTSVVERKVRQGLAGPTGAGLPAVQMEDDVRHTPPGERPPLDGDAARALLKAALSLHLVGEAVPKACRTVYDLCVREKLDPPSIQVLMRTMLEAHAPSALRGANATLNLLGLIVPIVPDNPEWFTGSYREILVHMMIGVAQATAPAGEPALSDAFLGQAAIALTAIPPSEREGKCSHPDGRHFRLDLVRQFAIDVLGRLPANSAGAFLHPLRKLDWLMENVACREPHLLNHLFGRLVAGFGLCAPDVRHEHLDRLTDFVLSLGLSLPDAGLQLSPCMATWEPWLPEETPQEAYRRGILDRMSGRPTLSPERAGEAVLATLVRHAIASQSDGESLAWQYPAFGSLARFDTLAGIPGSSLLVPGMPAPQQARLLRLALMASGRKPGADEFRGQMHQLVVDQALRGTDLEALSLLACAFVRAGGAKDTKSLERAVNIAPVARRKPKAEASSSTTTTSPQATTTGPSDSRASSSAAMEMPPARDSREIVRAVQRGGVLAGTPLKALGMEDLDWTQRLNLLDGALAIAAPLPAAQAEAMARTLESAPCTDAVKAQALRIILRHAGRDFAAAGQKHLWGLLAKGLEAEAPATEATARKAGAGRPAKVEVVKEDDTDDPPVRETKASGPALARQQFLFAKEAPQDVLKIAYEVVREDANRAWDAVEKSRGLSLAHDRGPLLELLDATLARLAVARDAAARSKDPRAQQIVKEADGRIKTLSQARREFTPPSAKG